MIHDSAVRRTALALTLVLGACGDDLPTLGTSNHPVSSAPRTAAHVPAIPGSAARPHTRAASLVPA